MRFWSYFDQFSKEGYVIKIRNMIGKDMEPTDPLDGQPQGLAQCPVDPREPSLSAHGDRDR